MRLCSGNKNIWTRAHHLLIRLGHRGKWICLEKKKGKKKKRRQAAKILIVLDHRPPQKKERKKNSRWLMYLGVHNERTTTQIQCGFDGDVGRGMCQATCALCVLMPEEYCGEARWGRAGGGRGRQWGWQWLRRWGFDGKVTKSSNKMRLVD